MIIVEKNKKRMSIPAGALKKFKNAGWTPLDELQENPDVEDEDITINTDEPETDEDEDSEDTEDDSEGEDDDEGDEDSDEDEDLDETIEELLEKPLNDLNKEELITLAEYKGLDVDELKTAKQLRNALRDLD